MVVKINDIHQYVYNTTVSRAKTLKQVRRSRIF